METGRKNSHLENFRKMYIDARELPQVQEFVSMNRREIYINIGARIDANVVKLAFRDEDLFT